MQTPGRAVKGAVVGATDVQHHAACARAPGVHAASSPHFRRIPAVRGSKLQGLGLRSDQFSQRRSDDLDRDVTGICVLPCTRTGQQSASKRSRNQDGGEVAQHCLLSVRGGASTQATPTTGTVGKPAHGMSRHEGNALTGSRRLQPSGGFEDNGWLEAYCPPNSRGSSTAIVQRDWGIRVESAQVSNAPRCAFTACANYSALDLSAAFRPRRSLGLGALAALGSRQAPRGYSV